MIPYYSFQNFPEAVRQEWISETSKVLKSGVYISGQVVSNFENEFAKYLGVNHVVGVGNGYDGLVAALYALKLAPGSKVAVPAHTFIACWNAITSAQLEPVGVDIDEFGNIDLAELESLPMDISAVIVVHMHGVPIQMPEVMNWAKKRNVLVIEDCSQAHGATLNGMKVGSFGDLGVFSFYPTKNLPAAGDAGGVSTDNSEYAARVRQFCNYGSNVSNKYNHVDFGVNSRLDPMQAAILTINLKHLDEWNSQRADLAKLYDSLLQNLDAKPVHQGIKTSVYHHYLIASELRTPLKEHLLNEGVNTEIHYPFLASDEWHLFRKLSNTKYPKASNFAQRILSLPLYPWLQKSDIHKIAEKVRNFPGTAK